MSEQIMRKIVAIAILASSVGAIAQAKPVKYRCSATKNTVEHSLDIGVDGDKVSDWSYFAATPAGDSSLTCSLDSTHSKESGSTGERQRYITDAGNVTVTKIGKSFVFDFSKIRAADACGQSSAMAKHLTIKPGSKRCTNVANAT